MKDDVDGLERTLDSVRIQTKFSQIEYIVKSYGSLDVRKLLETYDDENLIYTEIQDSGIYDAMNQGLAFSNSEIIGFLHAGDVFANENVLTDILNFFANGDYSLVYGNLWFSSIHHGNRLIRRWDAGNFTQRDLDLGWMPPHPTVYFRRELLETCGEFDSKYHISADYKWLLTALKKSKNVGYLNQCLVIMADGGTSNKNFKARFSALHEDYKVLTELGFRYPYVTVFVKRLRKIIQFFYG